MRFALLAVYLELLDILERVLARSVRERAIEGRQYCAAPPLVRLPRDPLVQLLVLGEEARRRRVCDDAGLDFAEDVLGYGEPEGAAHVRLPHPGVGCELGEGGFAADGDKLDEVEMGYTMDADEFGCLRVNSNASNMLTASATATSTLDR